MLIPSEAAWPPLVHGSSAHYLLSSVTHSISVSKGSVHRYSASLYGATDTLLVLTRCSAPECPFFAGEEFMTLFDDQPSARDVRNRQQAWSGEDAQHASCPSPGKPSSDAATECCPNTPEQWVQDANELGFTTSKRLSGGQGGSRYSSSDAQGAKPKYSRARPAQCERHVCTKGASRRQWRFPGLAQALLPDLQSGCQACLTESLLAGGTQKK